MAALGEELKAKGLATFKDVFPSKITQLQALLNNELLQKANEDILPPVADVTPPLLAAAAAAGGGDKADGASGGGGRKKRKVDGGGKASLTAAHPAPPHSDSEVESEDEAHPPHGHHVDYTFAVPSNQHIMDVIEMLRKEWKEAVEVVGAVKLWIQLSIPPIESGGQFHVGVQEEVIQELNRFEDVVRWWWWVARGERVASL